MTKAQLTLKRAYTPPDDGDGLRVLVDRLWPRGLEKHRAAIGEWIKDAAPSPDLRKWFGHDPARWDEFRRRYREELADNPAVGQIRDLAREQKVTLIYAAKDEKHNHALVLLDYLKGKS